MQRKTRYRKKTGQRGWLFSLGRLAQSINRTNNCWRRDKTTAGEFLGICVLLSVPQSLLECVHTWALQSNKTLISDQ